MIVFSHEQPLSLHHICANWVNNDNVHIGPKAIFNYKDIHSSSSVVREKVEDLLLNIYSTFQSNSCDSISKCIMGYSTLIHVKASK